LVTEDLIYIALKNTINQWKIHLFNPANNFESEEQVPCGIGNLLKQSFMQHGSPATHELSCRCTQQTEFVRQQTMPKKYNQQDVLYR